MEYENKISLKELHSLCRLCLNLSQDMHQFFSSESVQQLRECTGINAVPDHRLPSMICIPCIAQLSNCHAFFAKCHHTNNYLKSIIADEVVKQEVKIERDYNPFDSDNEDNTLPSIPFKCESIYDLSESSQIDKPTEAVKVERLDERNLKDDIDRTDNDCKIEDLKSSTSRVSSRLTSSLKIKSKVKTKKKGKKCPVCGLNVINRAALVNHMQIHDTNKPHVCSFCSRRFNLETALKLHVTRMHSIRDPNPDQRQTCVECGKSLSSAKHLKIHMRIHTGEMPYECTICLRRFTQIGSLIAHKRTHTGEKPYVCHLCGRAFTTRAHLRRHQSVHSKEKPFACSICDKRLKSEHALIQHNKLHTNEKDHVCEQCGLSFMVKINLDKHMRLKHSEKSGQCNVCKKICPNLKDHMVIHTGEKPYQCKTCDKKFSFKRGLLIHNHKHKFADKYKCDLEGCGRTFSRRWVFDCHVREHTGEMPFVCEICHKSYPRICHLTQHLKLSHPGEAHINPIEIDNGIIVEKE